VHEDTPVVYQSARSLCLQGILGLWQMIVDSLNKKKITLIFKIIYSKFVFVVGTQGFVVKYKRGQLTQGYSFLTSLA